ncbi:MAG: class I SAM-dependent methyltransferase [Myxococcales bacterium]
MSAAFDKSYFQTSYRDYFAQNPPAKVATYANLVRSHLGAGTLLEVGCAFGLYAVEMARFLRVTATDISEYAIQQARGLPGAAQIQWHAGEIAALRLTPEQYDGVAAFDVLEHIPDIERYLRELITLLKPGGFLFVTVPVYDGPLGWAVRLLDKDPTHVHKWARKAWSDLARRHGLALRDQIGLFRWGVGRQYLFFAHRLLQGVSPAMFLILQKPPRTPAPTPEKDPRAVS